LPFAVLTPATFCSQHQTTFENYWGAEFVGPALQKTSKDTGAVYFEAASFVFPLYN